MHSWNLEKIYSKQVKNSVPVPPPNRLKVLGESVSLYRKKGDDYELIGDVDDEYYDNTLSRYIKLGSPGSTELRKQIQKILKKSDADDTDNVNTFQSYVEEGRFVIDDESQKVGERVISDCIQNNEGIMIDSFINKIYGTNVDVGNKYFKKAWSASPAAAVMGRAGEGELFLAFFCNGIKPEKGDLKVGSENIEIKGYNGRLYKSEKIDTKQAYEELANSRIEDTEDLLDSVVNMIDKLSGTTKYSNEVRELLETENIKNDIIKNYTYFKQKGKLPTLSTIVKIAGTVQLLAYKEAQKFDSMVAFNNTLGGNNIWLQFINLKDINTVQDMWNRINNLVSSVRFAVRTDGFGFSLQVNVDKNPDMVRRLAQNYGINTKGKSKSARKVDTKDKGISSLLDLQ